MRGLDALRALAVVAVLAATACASLSENECRGGDWDAVGRADGARGTRADEIERHQKACARHDVMVDEEAWRGGYFKGLEAFCTPSGGYVAARAGERHDNVCFGIAGEERFMAAFRDGEEVHRLLREMRDLRQRLHDYKMAAMSGDYDEYEASRIRMRAAEVESALRRRQWEAEALDKRYAVEHGASPLPAGDLR
jgi:Protein of unknown function (DUF2799)